MVLFRWSAGVAQSAATRLKNQAFTHKIDKNRSNFKDSAPQAPPPGSLERRLAREKNAKWHLPLALATGTLCALLWAPGAFPDT